jgi:hypothetical protein
MENPVLISVYLSLSAFTIQARKKAVWARYPPVIMGRCEQIGKRAQLQREAGAWLPAGP